MTGYKSKKASALDEEGMYLVHHTKGRTFDNFGSKVPDDDDDTQVYKKPWVGFTDKELDQFHNWKDCTWSTNELVRYVESTLKSKNI